MSAGHHRPATLAGESILFRISPEAKVAATVLFVLAVVATPREAFWAFALYAAAVLGLGGAAGLAPRMLARRLTIELPFLGFALFLPLVGEGPRVDVAGVPLSTDGLWAAWNILIKGSLGVAASSLLVATTDTRAILRGLERLRVPRVFVAIASFMVRYLEVITGELRAMRIARVARGYDPRWIWQARAVAASAATLFIRSYERGERVHLAMLARGYDGTMPTTAPETRSTGWALAMVLPAAAAVVATAAWLVG